MPEPDLDDLRVFDPNDKSDPEEQFPADATEEVAEYETAENLGGSSWRSQGHYGNPNDFENHGTTGKADQSVPSGHVGIPSADDDPMADPHPVGDRPDSEIQEDIAAYLRQHTETDLSGVDFEVMTGTVILKGDADSRAQEILDMTIRGIAGVKEIRNEIKTSA